MKRNLLVILACVLIALCVISCDDPKHEHSYGTEWKYNDTTHWHECSCGAKSEEAKHTLEWTESKDGSKDYQKCEVCGYKTEEVAHTYGDWEKADDSHVKRTCDKCKHVDTADGVAVATKDAFNSALTNATEGKEVKIVLTDNIALENNTVDTDDIKIEKKKIEIDFNGKTLTIGRRFRVKDSTLVLSGKGTLKVTNDNSAIWVYGSTTDSDDKKEFTVLTVGEITIEGNGGISTVSLSDDSGYNAVKGNCYGVVVNLNGTTFNTKFRALYANGMIENTTGNVPVFNLENVKITQDATGVTVSKDSDPVGIYAAGYAKWNIENTTIESQYSAIEIRAGELNIKSGTFKSSATEFKVEANGNGSTSEGAAIAVAQHTTGLPIKVEISGGEFSGFHAMTVMNPQSNNAESCKEVSVEVTGGKFTATDTTVVNVADSFKLSDNAKYNPASFKVTAKTTT